MKKYPIVLLVLLFTGFNSFAQADTSAKTKPGFSFGPRIGIGQSKLIGAQGICEPSISVNASITASWEFKRFFGIEFSPEATLYNAKLKRFTQNGVDNLGNPMLYPFKEIFNIYSVEFPAMAKFSIRRKNVSLQIFCGPGIGLNMGGTHSIIYDDAYYNGHNGFSGHPMNEIKDSFFLCAGGVGIKFKAKKGFYGIDFRMQRTSPVSGTGDSKFSAQNATIGLSWQLAGGQDGQ